MSQQRRLKIDGIEKGGVAFVLRSDRRHAESSLEEQTRADAETTSHRQLSEVLDNSMKTPKVLSLVKSMLPRVKQMLVEGKHTLLLSKQATADDYIKHSRKPTTKMADGSTAAENISVLSELNYKQIHAVSPRTEASQIVASKPHLPSQYDPCAA